MTQQPWGQQPAQQPSGQPAWGQQQPQPWGQRQPAWGQPVAQRPAQGYPPQAPYQGQPGGYPPVPPQRGRGSLKLVLLGVVAVIAVGFFAFSLTSFINGSGEVAGPTPLPAEPTTAPPTPPGPEPVPTPEVGETSAPPTGVPEPDFDPPDLPVPTTWEELDDWLTNNAIYAESTLVPTDCTLTPIDVTTATVEALQEHLNTLTGCLMMVWQEPMQRAGFIMPRPPITVYTSEITTACGVITGINASYCPGDQRMYYSAIVHTVFERYNPQVIGNAFLPDLIMGHEFGHAIQGRSGILAAQVIASQQRAETESEKLELSRRAEVQADCLAGIFLNSVAQASRMTPEQRVGIAEISEAIGDDTLNGMPGVEGNHGWGVNRRHWTESGLASNTPNVCNTFTAPADKVR